MSEPEPTPAPSPTPDPTPAPQATPPALDKGGGNALLILIVVGALAAAVGYQLYSRPDVKALLQKANDRARSEGLEKAIPDFLAAVEAAPDDPQANLALGRALLFLDRADEALPHLEQAAAKLDGEADSNDLLGRCLVGLDRFDEAEKLFETSRRRRPDDPMPLRDLAILASQRPDLPRAAELLRAYLDRSPKVDMLTIQMYRDIVGALGRPEDAIAPLTSLALLIPNDVRLRRDIQERRLAHEGHDALLAEAARTAQDPKASAVDLYLAGRILTQDHRRLAEGKQAWERGRALDAKQPWLALALGVTAMKERDFAKARALLEPISKEKELPEAAFFLAKLDQAEGKLEEARKGFEAVMQTNTRVSDDARDEVLVVLVRQGKVDEALKLVRGAIPPGISGPAAERARGLVRELEELVLRKAGRFDEALALHDEAEKKATEGSRSYLHEGRGMVLLEAGRYADAAAAFDAALKDLPAEERPPPHLLLWAGVAHDRAGDLEGARALWQRGAEGGREHFPEALSTWACRRLVGVAPAEDLLGAALLGDPTDQNDAWFLEGLARLRAGDETGAKEAWTKAAELGWPGDFPGRLVEVGLGR